MDRGGEAQATGVNTVPALCAETHAAYRLCLPWGSPTWPEL